MGAKMPIEWGATEHGIQTAVAKNAEEFLQALRRSSPHWWDGMLCPWIFRGHARSDWSLLPTAWRPNNQIVENCVAESERRHEAATPEHTSQWMGGNFVTGVADIGPDGAELLKSLSIAITSEYLPLWDFSANCDALGMSVPLLRPGPDPDQDPDWLPDVRFPISADELLRSTDLPAALALAQHHGLPTRLLDWTSDPVAAAFFAVEALAEPEPEVDLAVWALHRRRAHETRTEGITFPNGPQWLKRIDPAIQIVRTFTRDNPYLAAQSGLFTTIAHAGVYYVLNQRRRPSIEAFVADANPEQPVLRKLILRREHASKLREILRRERISRSALMPTVDNVAADVRGRWQEHGNG